MVSSPITAPVSTNTPSPRLQLRPTCAPRITCAKAQTRVPSPTSSLSTMAAGWYLRAASSLIESPLRFSRSASDAEAQQDRRAQHRPPAGDRLHLRIADGLRRVDLGDRRLGRPVAEADRLPVEIGLELVLVEPALVQVDARVVEQLGAEGAEAVGRLGHALAGGQREQHRVQPGGEVAVEGHAARAPARQ